MLTRHNRCYAMKKLIQKIKRYIRRSIIIGILLLFFLFPIYWVFTTAFRHRIDVFCLPPKWIFEPTLENFQWIFQHALVGRWLKNSAIISLGTVVMSLILGAPAAYGFARFSFKGKKSLLTAILIVRILPPVVILLPFRVMMYKLGLFGNLVSVIFVDTIYNTAFAIWLLSGYFIGLPLELEEAARIDGCSWLRTFWCIALPLAKPGLATVAIFSFILSWNDFIFALGLTTPDSATLPVGILRTFGAIGIGWTYMTAMCCIAIIVPMAIAVWLQKYYLSGLTFGGVKG